MGKSAPDAPDYTAAAEQTGASNKDAIRDQTWANRVDQYNPWGSITFDTAQERDPATGEMVTKWSQNQELNPEAQSALDSQLGIDRAKSEFASRLMGKAGNTLLQDTDYSKFQGYGGVPQITERELGIPQYGNQGGGSMGGDGNQGRPMNPKQPVQPPPRNDVMPPPSVNGMNPPSQKQLEMSLLRGKRSNDVMPQDYT